MHVPHSSPTYRADRSGRGHAGQAVDGRDALRQPQRGGRESDHTSRGSASESEQVHKHLDFLSASSGARFPHGPRTATWRLGPTGPSIFLTGKRPGHRPGPSAQPAFQLPVARFDLRGLAPRVRGARIATRAQQCPTYLSDRRPLSASASERTRGVRPRTVESAYQPGASWKPQCHPFSGRWNG